MIGSDHFMLKWQENPFQGDEVEFRSRFIFMKSYFSFLFLEKGFQISDLFKKSQELGNEVFCWKTDIHIFYLEYQRSKASPCVTKGVCVCTHTVFHQCL